MTTTMIITLLLIFLRLARCRYFLKTIIGDGILNVTGNGDGGPASEAKIISPKGMWSDTIGNLYICEAANAVIRRVSDNGIISTIVGTGFSDSSGTSGVALSTSISGVYSIYGDSIGETCIFQMVFISYGNIPSLLASYQCMLERYLQVLDLTVMVVPLPWLT